MGLRVCSNAHHLPRSTIYLPIVTYAASGWSDLLTESSKKTLQSLQLSVLKKVIKAHNTVSYDAACVVAGAIPIDLALEERRALFNLRKERDVEIDSLSIRKEDLDNRTKRFIRSEVLNMWQTRWSNSTKGAVTKLYFEHVCDRLRSHWIKPDFFTTQLLTGHGEIRSKLFQRNLTEQAECECRQVETVEHIILECEKFCPQRLAILDLLGSLGLRTDTVKTLVRKETFHLFADFAREVMWLNGERRARE